MDTAQSVIRLLPWVDWAALLLFFAGWGGYVWFARHLAHQRPSLLASTNRIRRDWMLQVTHREVRVVDGVLLQVMSTSPSFFASTTILIIGGLLGGVLGIALSLLVGWGFEQSGSSFKLVYSTTAMVVAFVCSTLIGVVFGFLPANSAARLNPVDALARE